MIASSVRGGVARAVVTGGCSVARRPSVVSSAWRGACPSAVVSSRGFASKKPEDHPYLTNHANARYLPGFSFPAPRKLKDIVKLQLLERESTHHIRDIWLDHHSERGDCVAGALTVPEYKELEDRGRKWPRFVYPVFKENGAFFMLLGEWQDRSLIFTYLEHAKQNLDAAEPYMALTMYDDLAKRKQIALLRGDFSHHLTKDEAHHVVELMRHFYLREWKSVETFNTSPNLFDFQRFMDSCPRPEFTKRDSDIV